MIYSDERNINQAMEPFSSREEANTSESITNRLYRAIEQNSPAADDLYREIERLSTDLRRLSCTNLHQFGGGLSVDGAYVRGLKESRRISMETRG